MIWQAKTTLTKNLGELESFINAAGPNIDGIFCCYRYSEEKFDCWVRTDSSGRVYELDHLPWDEGRTTGLTMWLIMTGYVVPLSWNKEKVSRLWYVRQRFPSTLSAPPSDGEWIFQGLKSPTAAESFLNETTKPNRTGLHFATTPHGMNFYTWARQDGDPGHWNVRAIYDEPADQSVAKIAALLNEGKAVVPIGWDHQTANRLWYAQVD